jgi:hypothetical protein
LSLSASVVLSAYATVVLYATGMPLSSAIQRTRHDIPQLNQVTERAEGVRLKPGIRLGHEHAIRQETT